MAIKLREGRPEDAQACGAIAYEAFKSVAEEQKAIIAGVVGNRREITFKPL